jgi:cytidyltransferase-like protein
MKNVFVSGCFDPLHAGHIAFFGMAARYGRLFVGVGSDKSIEHPTHKNHKTLCNEQERLFVVKSIKSVSDAFILSGIGILDFVEDLSTQYNSLIDIFIVNEDQDLPGKREACEKLGIEYIVLKRAYSGIPSRSSTQIRNHYLGVDETPKKKILVAGTFDLVHSGHVAFFRRAAEHGEIYVGINSDASAFAFKNRQPINPEHERLYMVKAIRYVKDAWINKGIGDYDFMDDLEKNHAIGFDKFIINEDQDTDAKREYCEKNGIELVILKRTPDPGLPVRSSVALRRYSD